MDNNLLPLGTRDEFGRRASQKQHIISVIEDSFIHRGFAKISTPLVEKQAVFEPYKLGNYQMYRLLDQEGDTIVLRPDMTLPIARFLSSTNISLPQKFWYIGDIFRISRRLSGSYNELTQAGIELVGYSSLKAEFECLILINQLSQKLLSEPVEIELGIADFTQLILSELTDDKQLQNDIADSLFNKEVPQYENLIQTFSQQDKYQFLLKWPRLFGDADRILAELTQYDFSDQIEARISELIKVVDWIKKTMPQQKLSIDLSSRAPQNYYTGLTFKGFSQAGSGYLFSGGRYDKLLANFQDVGESAVGMGIDIDLLTDILVKDAPVATKNLIYFDPDQWQKAEQQLNQLPNAILSLSDNLEGAQNEAHKLKAKLIDLTEGEYVE